MQTTKLLSLVLLSTLLLTSCFWSKEDLSETKSPAGIETNNALNSQIMNQAITEQQRIAKLDTLTSDNLSTQTEEKDGKKILKDRRLFINYFKAEKVDTSAKLITALEKVEKFAKSE